MNQRRANFRLVLASLNPMFRTSAWILCLTTGACTASAVLPAAVPEGAELLPVTGLNESGDSDPFALGDYHVINIDHSWKNLQRQEIRRWTGSARDRAFRFDVEHHGRVLRGMCLEKPVDKQVAGIALKREFFGCVCTEDESEFTLLELNDGEGTLRADWYSFDVLSRFAFPATRTKSRPIAYDVRGHKDRGMLEVDDQPRAWLPRSVAPEQRMALVCGYAGLLLRH